MKNNNEIEKWLISSVGDLTLAKKGKISKKIPYEPLCFHAQQAAEKGLKAILIFKNKEFEKTHSIARLLELINETGLDIPPAMKETISLTRFATRMRYPTNEIPVTQKEYKEVIKLAEKVLKWTKSIIEKKNGNLF
ncbi:MAG: HEPN domain-containing protein [Bacteroidia bacterium]|nr:HEPN domain-containing protein [Bacteroidia bacterium]